MGVGESILKPENIFLAEDPDCVGGERVKILDFGIAKFLHADPGKQTSTGMVLGTPKYISPEQCDGREHLSGKSDVYSLGIILYEMLAGAAPFHAKAAMAFMRQHMVAAPPSLRGRASHVPKEVHELIHAMLAKDPPSRPDMTQVLERLRQIQDPGHAEKVAQQAALRPARTALWLVAVAVALLSLLGVFYYTRESPGPLPPAKTLIKPVIGPATGPALGPTPKPLPPAPARPDLASPAAEPVPPKPLAKPESTSRDGGTPPDAEPADLSEPTLLHPDPEPPPAEPPEPPPAVLPPPAKHPAAKPSESRRRGGKHGKHARPHATRSGKPAHHS